MLGGLILVVILSSCPSVVEARNVRDDAYELARAGAPVKCLPIARLAAPFGIASSVHGYADKDECDDNH